MNNKKVTVSNDEKRYEQLAGLPYQTLKDSLISICKPDNSLIDTSKYSPTDTLNKLKTYAHKHKNKLVETATELQIINWQRMYWDLYRTNYDSLFMIYNNLLKESKDMGLEELEIDVTQELASIYNATKQYDSAFLLCNKIIQYLEKIDDSAYNYNKATYYYNIGLMYFEFKDFDIAVQCYRKAISFAHSDKNILLKMSALNNIGMCYAFRKQYDKALEAFTVIMKGEKEFGSNPLWKRRKVFAQANIGYVLSMQNEELKAIPLLEDCLNHTEIKNIQFQQSTAVDLAHAYIKTNQVKKAETVIRKYLSNQRLEPKYSSLYYDVMSKYYTAIKQYDKALIYSNKRQNIEQEENEKTNAAHLLYTQQLHNNLETRIKDEKIERQYYRMLWLVTALCLMTFILVIWIIYSRRLRIKNRSIYNQIIEQERLIGELETQRRINEALNLKTEDDNEQNDEKISENMKIFKRLQLYMQMHKTYTSKILERKEVADMINTNQQYLHQAIKECTGLTFIEYINTLRLQHARNMLVNNNNITIDIIADESGFASRATFYRLFYRQYGISPGEFRNMAKNKNNL
jgi:AraC-like DNA-binding protein